MRTLTRRQRIAAMALSALALVFISFDFASSSLRDAHDGVRGALGSLYRGTDSVLGPVRRFVQGIPDVGSNREQIAKLEDQNKSLTQQLTDAKIDAATATQLRALQLQANSTGWQILPARVTATGPGSGFGWTVTLDVGTSAGVQVGQTVSDGGGLVGRVIASYSSSSVVLLIADAHSAVGVRDARSGQLLLASGASRESLAASPLGTGVDVKVGDRLQTGPAGQSTYAAGIEVGIVTSVSPDSAGAPHIAVRPTASMTGLDLVGVVLLQPSASVRNALSPQGTR